MELLATCFVNLAPHGWPRARRFVVARRFIPGEESQTTLFTLGRYVYRAWVTNMELTPAGVWHFYDGRAGMEPRICELRADYALSKIPTRSFRANALYLEFIRLAHNLVTAFQPNCLDESWQSLTLQKLRYQLLLIPGERAPDRTVTQDKGADWEDHWQDWPLEAHRVLKPTFSRRIQVLLVDGIMAKHGYKSATGGTAILPQSS